MSKNSTSSFKRVQGRARVGFEARRAAARFLGLVVDEKLSLAGMFDAKTGHASLKTLIAKDRALVRAIVTTAVRHRGQILAVLKYVMDRPEPKRARDLSHALHVGVAQILFMDVPDSAAVNLTVSLVAENRKTTRFKGFANAVMRRVSREKDELLANTVPKASPYPAWFSKRLRKDYGKQNSAEIAKMIMHEPLLDVSLKHPDKQQEWADRLKAFILPTGTLRLKDTSRVETLDGFEEGAWWVQNAAAAIPALLFGEVKGKHIADLCAAPGGKSAQLAARGAKVTTVDIVASRLERLEQNMKRLGLRVTSVNADLLEWEPTDKFDGILLDAPCSSTGTVRRHPDVLWTKGGDDVIALSALQYQMVKRAIDWLKPGGILVFATCSIFKAEGEDVLARLLAGDLPIELEKIKPEEVGGIAGTINGQGAFRSLPFHCRLADETAGGMDGFFAARVRRI